MDDVEIMVEGCDSYPDDEGTFVNCEAGFNRNKKYYWLVFSGQDMIIDSKVEDTND
jgi:hypothetical protein